MRTNTTQSSNQAGGQVWNLSAQFASGHTLVAGITGSGKSVLINRILGDCIAYSPQAFGFVLIDPKRVELFRYAKLPHTIRYADSPTAIVDALNYAIGLMDSRYIQMRKHGLTHYDGQSVLVVVDELADLMTTQRKTCLPLLQRLAQLGRAAKVFLLCATQSPSRKTIPAELTLNFQNRVALHCFSQIESRQIIGSDHAITLPRYGQAYWRTADGRLLFVDKIPPISDETIAERIACYIQQKRSIFDRIRRK